MEKDVVCLKEKIANDLDVKENLFDIVYCGQCLKAGMSLQSAGIHQGSTVHLISRLTELPSPACKDVSPAEVKQLQSLLQSTLKSPAYRSTVENIVSSPERLHQLVEDVPGLNDNPSTLTMFLDVELMKILAHPGNIRRVLKAHPCFPQVAHKISDAVKEAVASGREFTSNPYSYSLDQMSDDEEDSAGASGGSAPGGITANQLAAALAAATGGSPAQRTGSEPLGGGRITSELFQQAILQAQRASFDSQVQQLREMGITDEHAARQALQATNGDVQAALDLLFGEGL